MARKTPTGQLVEALTGGLARDECLRTAMAAAPGWAGERMLSASEAVRATGSGMPAPRGIWGWW